MSVAGHAMSVQMAVARDRGHGSASRPWRTA